MYKYTMIIPIDKSDKIKCANISNTDIKLEVNHTNEQLSNFIDNFINFIRPLSTNDYYKLDGSNIWIDDQTLFTIDVKASVRDGLILWVEYNEIRENS